MTMESELKFRTELLKNKWAERRKVSYVLVNFWTVGKQIVSLRVSFHDRLGPDLEYDGDTIDDVFTRAYADLAVYLTPEEKSARDYDNLASVLGIVEAPRL